MCVTPRVCVGWWVEKREEVAVMGSVCAGGARCTQRSPLFIARQAPACQPACGRLPAPPYPLYLSTPSMRGRHEERGRDWSGNSSTPACLERVGRPRLRRTTSSVAAIAPPTLPLPPPPPLPPPSPTSRATSLLRCPPGGSHGDPPAGEGSYRPDTGALARVNCAASGPDPGPGPSRGRPNAYIGTARAITRSTANRRAM
jgi:hypothetical protein